MNDSCCWQWRRWCWSQKQAVKLGALRPFVRLAALQKFVNIYNIVVRMVCNILFSIRVTHRWECKCAIKFIAFAKWDCCSEPIELCRFNSISGPCSRNIDRMKNDHAQVPTKRIFLFDFLGFWFHISWAVVAKKKSIWSAVIKWMCWRRYCPQN